MLREELGIPMIYPALRRAHTEGASARRIALVVLDKKRQCHRKTCVSRCGQAKAAFAGLLVGRSLKWAAVGTCGEGGAYVRTSDGRHVAGLSARLWVLFDRDSALTQPLYPLSTSKHVKMCRVQSIEYQAT